MEANKYADRTLEEVKTAMGINYFINDEFVSEQVKKYKAE